MFNPVIIVALVLQSFVSRASRMAGAIAGYAITTGIMLWGFSVYGDGSQVTFFDVPLSPAAFFVLCIVWYGFDTKTFLRAKKASELSASPSSARVEC